MTHNKYLSLEWVKAQAIKMDFEKRHGKFYLDTFFVVYECLIETINEARQRGEDCKSIDTLMYFYYIGMLSEIGIKVKSSVELHEMGNRFLRIEEVTLSGWED